MSVKKFLVLSVAGIAALGAAAAEAGGPDMMAPPAPVDSGIYIDADAGWVRSNWSNFWGGAFLPAPMANASAVALNTVTSHGNSGFVWGGDIGYQFNRHFSAEAGWYKLPTVAGSQGVVAAPGGNQLAMPLQQRSWFLYFAGKLAFPITDKIDLFGKAGLAWRYMSYSGNSMSFVAVTNLIPNSAHYWAPFLGVGAQYSITSAWSANIQYLHVAANTRDAGVLNPNDVPAQAPSANLVVAGVGYKFAI